MSDDLQEARVMTPDERVLRAHLARGSFQSGIDRRRWRLIEIRWPHVMIAISAADRDQAPTEYVVRLDCQNYPQAAPTGAFWDLQRKAQLEAARWPGGSGRVAKAFNPDWKEGRAIYLPCDRVSLADHSAWPRDHPQLVWSPERDITHCLRILHDYLHSRDYTGLRCPPP